MSEVTGRYRWIAAIVVFLSLVVVPTASAGNKPYSVVISPGNVSSGTATTTAKINNETSHQRLGAANLVAPAQFTITSIVSLSVPPPATATLVKSCTASGVTGSCVQLRNLALPPGRSVTVTMIVNTSAATCGSPTSYSWSVQAKQANNFNGVGNDLDLDTNHSSLTTTVSCAGASTPCLQGKSCSISLSTSTSTVDATASPSTNGSNDAGTLSGTIDPGQPLMCSGYSAKDRNWYGVVETPVSGAIYRAKTITYTLKNTSPQGVEVCFGAPYEFETIGDQKAPPGTLPDGSSGFVGLLEHCESFPEPPEACVASITGVPDPSISSGQNTVATIRIDAGLPGDPWGRM